MKIIVLIIKQQNMHLYNKILMLIQDGLYPEGSKLPTEPLLAKQMGISRMTLRQSLVLLQEDGIIESRMGIGNFVRKTLNKDSVGLEKMSNPVYKSCLDNLSSVIAHSKYYIPLHRANLKIYCSK